MTGSRWSGTLTVTVTRSTSGCRAKATGSEKASEMSKCLAVASALACRVVHTAVISKSDRPRNAGICATEAKPRSGLAPTMPTRILSLVVIALPHARQALTGRPVACNAPSQQRYSRPFSVHLKLRPRQIPVDGQALATFPGFALPRLWTPALYWVQPGHAGIRPFTIVVIPEMGRNSFSTVPDAEARSRFDG